MEIREKLSKTSIGIAIQNDKKIDDRVKDITELSYFKKLRNENK